MDMLEGCDHLFAARRCGDYTNHQMIWAYSGASKMAKPIINKANYFFVTAWFCLFIPSIAALLRW